MPLLEQLEYTLNNTPEHRMSAPLVLTREEVKQLVARLKAPTIQLTPVNIEDEQLLKADGYDDAIVGVARPPSLGHQAVLVYDASKVIEILGGDEDALEFFDYNIEQAYMGLMTPIFFHPGSPL